MEGLKQGIPAEIKSEVFESLLTETLNSNADIGI